MNFNVLIDVERCKGCGYCVAACSSSILTLSTALNSKGMHFAERVDSQGCIGCLKCTSICPDAAIEVEQLGNGSVRKTRRGKRR